MTGSHYFKAILSTLLFLFFISSLQAQNQDEVFSENFINAIAKKDIDELVKLKPHADFWRVLLEKETKGMTDEEINLKANKNEKFIQDYENIMYSAKKEQIDLNKLEFKKVKIQKIWDDENMPLDMTIKFLYEDKEGEFSLSVYEYEGIYYLSEILNSYDIFSKIK
jgi:hypothetical protein